MDFAVSAILIMSFIIVYYLLIQIFSVLFRISGLTRLKARFQVISLLTNSGYTTSESEVIVSDRFRRRLATSCMISGYAFSVIIISLIVNLLTNLNTEQMKTSFTIVLYTFAGFVVALFILNLPPVKKSLNKFIEMIATIFITRGNKENIITLLDNYGKSALAEVYLNALPEPLKDKSLAQSNLKANYNINIMMVKRKGRVIEVHANTIIQKGDSIVVFGSHQSIKDLFSHTKNDDIETINVSKDNIIDLIDNYGKEAMASVTVNTLPEILVDKPLFESGFKDKYQVSILTVTRDEKNIPVNKDTVILEHDVVVVFGSYSKIKEAFLEM